MQPKKDVPDCAAARQAYWFQFTEYATQPAIQRFESAAQLLAMLAALPFDRAPGGKLDVRRSL